MALSNVALVMFTVLLMQLVAAGAWALGRWGLQLPARPTQLWSAAGLLGAGSIALVLLRGTVPMELALPVSNLLLVASTLALMRGMRAFLGQPLRGREARVVLVLEGLTCLVTAPEVARGGVAVIAACTSALVLWLYLRGAWDGWHATRREFGARAAGVLTLPLALMCVMVAMRLAGVLATGKVQALHVDSLPNVAISMAYLVAMTLLQLSMASMVVLRLVDSLRRLSSRDALTGLANRGEFLNQLGFQHRWLGRFGQPFSLLMVDIDHFKRVNDTWGHPAGDAVLVGTAQLLSAAVRGVDIAGRLGGEEFAVLLPNTGTAAAQAVAERLRKALADTRFDWKQESIAVTASIGVATASDVDETPELLVERADAALYQAKNAGRNRVVVSEWTGAAMAEITRPVPLPAVPATPAKAPVPAPSREPEDASHP